MDAQRTATTAGRWIDTVVLRWRMWASVNDTGPWLILFVCIALLPLSLPRVALSDEVQYFAYLRSLYFDGDLDFRNEYTYFSEQRLAIGDTAIRDALLREDAVNPHPETGLLRNVAPVGSTMLWAPGFVLADGYVIVAQALGSSVVRDGYSQPYILGVCLMTLLYCFLGLQLTYRFARRYSDDFAATVATLTVFLATPLLFYSYIAMPWSHANGFFLFALFLTVWMRHWRRPAERTWGVWVILGLIGGLMVMTREQLGLLLIIPALEALGHYLLLLRRRHWAVVFGMLGRHVLFLATLVLAVTPQLWAYQMLNGRPLPSSTVGSKLIWTSPNFLNTLIDPGRGALLWAPVIALGLLGLIWLGRKDAWLALLLCIGFLAQTYINGAFGTTWHLRGAFGFRRLIECTPIFVLGLAALLAWLRPRVSPWPILASAALLVYWNLGLIAQWTILRPTLRRDLIWHDMIYWQFVEVPRQVISMALSFLRR